MRYLIMLFCSLVSGAVFSQNWNVIRNSGEYYYGVGHGKTELEASEAAMADLVSMIATTVSSDFSGLEEETNVNGNVDHKSKVVSCVKTYSQSTLTNVEKWVLGEEPEVTVRRYMKRSELSKIYEDRIAKAKDMIVIADESLQRMKVDMALQYYYWAYTLIRSVQRPNEVKDSNGKCLVECLPLKIAEVLDNIKVEYDKKDGDCVDLLFTYNGKPVSSLDFTYLDGRVECQGMAKDGRGMIEMVPGYDAKGMYHIDIEYQYKGQARGDAEVSGVLDVIPKRIFKNAVVDIKAVEKEVPKTEIAQTPVNATVGTATPGTTASGASMAAKTAKPTDITATSNTTTAASAVDVVKALIAAAAPDSAAFDTIAYVKVVSQVENAISKKAYSSVMRCFTVDGLDMFNRLISYGKGRIVGTPDIKLYKSSNGNVVARGLQMAFSFNRGSKKTFVEDVVFTLDSLKKISSVAFGLGQIATNDIMNRNASGWSDGTREQIMEFMENYKTAYCLQRLDYIRSIFADDAIIIIGNIVKPKHGGAAVHNERQISIEGQDVIKYNRYSKDQYLDNLAKCFRNNEFINLRFTNSDIQWLEKYEKEKIFAIQIGQEYNSSTYGDKGFLFLLVDMTNRDEPQIKIRTWQPNEVSTDKLYNAGDFYKD